MMPTMSVPGLQVNTLSTLFSSLPYMLILIFIGKGVFVRMKDIMAQHIKNNGECMFESSTSGVQKMLTEEGDSLGNNISQKTQEMVDRISGDFKSAFEESRDAEERAVDDELSSYLTTVSKFYEPVNHDRRGMKVKDVVN